MKKTIHYLLMSNHLLFQKALFSNIKDTELTLGQPKVLDFLLDNNGAFQKEIATACQIEPATITSVLLGMEKKQLIFRKKSETNRRNLYVYLTEKGRVQAERIKKEFDSIEQKAFENFSDDQKELLNQLLSKINDNLKGDVSDEKE